MTELVFFNIQCASLVTRMLRLLAHLHLPLCFGIMSGRPVHF